jgi:hypothetical protein
MAATKIKSLKVIEVIRDGDFFWQTDAKIPATMQSTLGWKEIDDGIFEVQRPDRAAIAAYGREVEAFGFKIKRTEQQKVVAAPVLEDEDKTEGVTKLKLYLDAKDEAAKAKETSEEHRDDLKEWMVEHAAPKDPAHPDARIAQIGKHKVHNSWVNGRETKWDDRDHKAVGDWAIGEDCANELVQVVIHKTVTFAEYGEQGIPDGFEGNISIDPDVYDFYVRTGAVPKEIHDAFEARGKGYYGVKVYETKDTSCGNCGSKVAKTAKFCGECGNKQE